MPTCARSRRRASCADNGRSARLAAEEEAEEAAEAEAEEAYMEEAEEAEEAAAAAADADEEVAERACFAGCISNGSNLLLGRRLRFE